MPLNKLPTTNKCCVCIPDLKTAVAIIVVLGIVTSPVVAWAIVRHSYVIRVSCYVTTDQKRPDVVDINLSNVLSFGFGANAGLGPSCLKGNTEPSTPTKAFVLSAEHDVKHPRLVKSVKAIGWLVLAADIIFLAASFLLLRRLFYPPFLKLLKFYIWALILTIFLSLIYGSMFVVVCMCIGGAFPLFELIFTIVDLVVWLSAWCYLVVIVQSYEKIVQKEPEPSYTNRFFSPLSYPASYLRDYYYQRGYWQMLLDWLFGRAEETNYATAHAVPHQY